MARCKLSKTLPHKVFGTETANATRSAQFNYEFNSWVAGSTVTFTGIIDGNTVATDTFTWDASDDMKIVFTGIETGSHDG